MAERVNPVSETIVVNTIDRKALKCEVVWPETNFHQKLELVEGIDLDGDHIKILSRRVSNVKTS